jgi:hypothetical protein
MGTVYDHANRACPVYTELARLLIKTVGVADVLKEDYRRSVNITTEKTMTPEQRSTIAAAPAIEVLRAVHFAWVGQLSLLKTASSLRLLNL